MSGGRESLVRDLAGSGSRRSCAVVSAIIDAVTYPRLEALGDRAVLVVLGAGVDAGTNAAARRLSTRLAAQFSGDDVEWVVGMASVAMIAATPLALPGLRERLQRALERTQDPDVEIADVEAGRRVELDVHYGGADGPDLDAIAAHAGLDVAATIAAHAGGDYAVACIGFQPGFPYLLGLDPRLAMPRHRTPRSAVAAGSVGIGGAQTGVYPVQSPGGWQLLGRIAERLFDPRRVPASLLAVGDRVRFRVATDRRRNDEVADTPVRAIPDATFPFPCGEPQESTGASAATPVLAAVATPAAASSRVDVLHPGARTTVQDLGRPGHRAIGVTPGGAADPAALELANLLVGNAPEAAGLEVLLRGPRLAFADARVVAWLGAAEAEVKVGELVIPRGRPALLPAGSELVVGALRKGVRLWLAVSGGIAVAPVLGARATDPRGGFGGLDGRALLAGDRLPLAAAPRRSRPHRDDDPPRLFGFGMRLPPLPARDAIVELRVLAGAHADALGERGPAAGGPTEWTVGQDSDRMGLRLAGTSLRLDGVGELPSAAALPGTVQLPPGGQPVILGVDGQTLGGYPRIAHVIAADLALLAQLAPGARLRLRRVDAGAALAANRAAAIDLQRAREGARQVAALEFDA